MNAVALLKALLINAAYQGSTAVCAPLQVADGKPLPIDPFIQDAGLQKKGVLVYEEAKVQYHAILRAFHDQTGIWPDPKVASESGVAPSIPGLLAQAAGALARLPRETPVGTIGQLLDLLSKFNSEAPRQPGQEL
ncbi:MAG: hypothetical protein JNM56_03305 [Planctomycetia bacterium]|nr:hypothetical protein [Planctomycetia bacterium]